MRSDIFSLLSKGQPVKRLTAPPSKDLKQNVYKQKEEGSQNKFKSKIPEGQEHAPRLEPTAPIRLAERNHAHYPSRQRTILKKRWLNDGLQAHAIQSTRKSSEDVTRTLEAPPSKVRCDIFPTPQRATRQTVESSSIQEAQTRCIQIERKRESE